MLYMLKMHRFIYLTTPKIISNFTFPIVLVTQADRRLTKVAFPGTFITTRQHTPTFLDL